MSLSEALNRAMFRAVTVTAAVALPSVLVELGWMPWGWVS